MKTGIVHSSLCKIGTSHSVPQDCKGADYKPIPYQRAHSEGDMPPVGPIEPDTNSEEGRKAVEVAAEADRDARGHSDGDMPPGDPRTRRALPGVNPDPDGDLDVIPGVTINPQA